MIRGFCIRERRTTNIIYPIYKASERKVYIIGNCDSCGYLIRKLLKPEEIPWDVRLKINYDGGSNNDNKCHPYE